MEKVRKRVTGKLSIALFLIYRQSLIMKVTAFGKLMIGKILNHKLIEYFRPERNVREIIF